jgi:hypothetical protein
MNVLGTSTRIIHVSLCGQRSSAHSLYFSAFASSTLKPENKTEYVWGFGEHIRLEKAREQASKP